MSHPSSPSGLARFLPILSWVPRYQRMWLRPDLIAGITVAALVLPFAEGLKRERELFWELHGQTALRRAMA